MKKTASSQLTFDQALSKAASLCGASECCVADIREKLTRWGVPSADAGKIEDYLIDKKYIDELRYARAYVMDKLRFQHWGRVKIGAMLRMKHVCTADIDQAMREIDADQYRDILRQVLESKQRSIKDDDPYIRHAKLIRFAMQRGFEISEIEKVIPSA